MANTLMNSAASEATGKLYLNDKFADVRFSFNINDAIETIPANKAILGALSPVFDAMFFGSLKESSEVKIVDSSVEAFKEFLQFFYLGKVTLTMENIETVARLADKYDVMQYVNACTEYVQSELKVDKMCWGLQLALNIKNQPLIEFCENQISSYPKKVFASEAFLRCEKSTLEHILRLTLTCSETDVFNACIEWAKNACREDGLDGNQSENVKAKLGDCFKLIQFQKLGLNEFINIHASNEQLFCSEEFQDIILQITRTEYKSKIFYECPRNTFVWDDTKVLECKRSVVNNTERKVQGVEVVSFSSNQPVLLGEIWSSETKCGGGRADGSKVNVTITQLEDNDFHSNDTPKTLYDGTRSDSSWSNGQLKVVLEKPILIKPRIIYEIRIEKSNFTYSYKGTWNPIAKLENGLEINFHRNPSLEYENATTGWISTLKLNKL